MSQIKVDTKAITKELGSDRLMDALKMMLLMRNFEMRAEAAYQQGYIGGFMHSYAGQEAIAVGCRLATTDQDWWITTYRCHGAALVLGEPPRELMSELFGRANGNAMGRGGSMHLYSDRLLGGFGIVGGQMPIAIGAAFSAKYREADEVALCFMGDGAVAQGAFHESVNLAAVWDLPCIFVIENNEWGMGTAVNRAISVEKIAESHAVGYGINGYTVDGTNLFDCYAAFKALRAEVRKTGRPVLLEMKTQRFRGHSISDPGLYRSKESLAKIMKQGPIGKLKAALGLSDDAFKALDKEQRQVVIDAVKHAEASPWPDPAVLGEGVFA